MFSIESTYDGRGLFTEDCIVGASTVTTGELVALTAGAGYPTATLSGATTVPHGIIVKGNTTGEKATFIRILPGDILVSPATAADGTTALSAGQITSAISLVGNQALRISATGLTLDAVNTSGGKLELVGFDSTTLKAKTRFVIVS
ncbi:MAG: hypothetical protein M0R80_13790 [Proteobacteria bacterium]|jgi:hypothetical protein|nr:hypothetical protein [Pseudomonadota bacterium]